MKKNRPIKSKEMIKGLLNSFNNKFEIYEHIFLFLYLVVYKIILEIIYVNSLVPQFDYYGLELNVNVGKLLISFVILFLVYCFLPKDKSYPSTFLYLIMIIMMYIPTLSYYWLNNKSTVYILSLSICFIIVSTVTRLKHKKIGFKHIKLNVALDFIFWIYIFISVYVVVKRGGIDVRAFNFQQIYNLRSEYNLDRLSGYLYNWSAKGFAPFFLIYFLHRKNVVKTAIVLVMQMVMYLSFGNKLFLFSLAYLIFIQFVLRSNLNSSKLFIGLMSLGNLIALVFEKLKITTILRDVLPYRSLFVPAMGQFRYYDFFMVHDKLKFSEGIIGRILSIEYPYNKPIGFIVNQFFRGTEFLSNGNTGVFSYAFADFGFLGMILAAIIVGLLFWLTDCATYNLPVVVSAGVLAFSMVIFNDTGLLISLWTGV
ncbi:hypothetical protein J0B03_04205 [Alkalibacter rhizosphaerae]|uniref:Oligosaccharide repeat unit polymerase n=1 Tax=Alkalibacter rhizosphaerae TaxID=2815577 RepID=A0A974XG72_9FIRM|nr:hypothetical protein [Alkalibacter rhizosphaerae]QSX09272.1 hypothetical protein J0B03_04205 [Alkalibacter rhizosphaerae]